MSSSKTLLAERMDLFNKAMNFEKPERVPTYGNVYAWKAIDSDMNVTIEDVGNSSDLTEKVMREFHERYQFDVYQNPGATRFASIKQRILGESRLHTIVKSNSVVSFDRSPMKDDEIREYYQDPVKFLWTKTAPRLYKEYEKGLTFGGAKELIADSLEFSALDLKINEMLLEEYGVPNLIPRPSSISTFLHPLEQYGMTRGLKNFGIDLRRRKDLVKEIISPMEEAMFTGVQNMLKSLDTVGCVFNVFTCVMMNTIISVKQFEEMYWPLMKKQFDYIQEQGARVFLLWEADCIRFSDYFNDYPKGMICLLPEMEDIRDVRRAFPNCTLCGGMPVDLLGQSTAEKCLDFAKQLVDDMGYGYILSQNKFLSYEYDAKRENLLTVQDFALNYNY